MLILDSVQASSGSWKVESVVEIAQPTTVLAMSTSWQ